MKKLLLLTVLLIGCTLPPRVLDPAERATEAAVDQCIADGGYPIVSTWNWDFIECQPSITNQTGL